MPLVVAQPVQSMGFLRQKSASFVAEVGEAASYNEKAQ